MKLWVSEWEWYDGCLAQWYINDRYHLMKTFEIGQNEELFDCSLDDEGVFIHILN